MTTFQYKAVQYHTITNYDLNAKIYNGINTSMAVSTKTEHTCVWGTLRNVMKLLLKSAHSICATDILPLHFSPDIYFVQSKAIQFLLQAFSICFQPPPHSVRIRTCLATASWNKVSHGWFERKWSYTKGVSLLLLFCAVLLQLQHSDCSSHSRCIENFQLPFLALSMFGA